MQPVLEFDHVHIRFPLFYAADRSLKTLLSGGPVGARHRQAALADLSFSLPPGARCAVLGENSAGKTTLLRAAAGLLQPQLGQIRRTGRAVALLSLGFGIDPDFTGLQTIRAQALLAGHDPAAASAITGRALEIAGFQADLAATPVQFLGPGERLRLGFGLAVALEAEILVIDEMLEHVGPDMQRRILTHIETGAPRRGAVLVVERAESILRGFCDQALVLEQGRALAQGPLEEIIAAHPGRYVF